MSLVVDPIEDMYYKLVYNALGFAHVEGKLISIGVPPMYAFVYTPGEVHKPLPGWGPFSACRMLQDMCGMCSSLRCLDNVKAIYQLWRVQGAKSDELNMYMPGKLFGVDYQIIQPIVFEGGVLLSSVQLLEHLYTGTLTSLVTYMSQKNLNAKRANCS